MAVSNSGSVGFLGVIIGAVIVTAIGFFLLRGDLLGGASKSVDINIKPPAITGK